MSESNQTIHTPVLLQEVITSLNLEKGDIVFDGTLGGGGYSEKICEAIGKEGTLLGTDLDQNALDRVHERLEKYPCKKKFFLKNYSEIKNILQTVNTKAVDKIVLDLGISSDQLAGLGRGISFQNLDDSLDMNLSVDENSKKLTASEILNTWSEESLADIFFYYGGERASKKLSAAIVEQRVLKDFVKVSDLVELIESEIGYFYTNKKIHSATKIFQALRITVNDEIGNLQKVLNDGIDSLEKDGIISVITFHSLEDKNVKKIFREQEDLGVGKRVNKKVIKPCREEVLTNRRSRSAKLRIFKKS
jgi:16S rRNA (cytosine1402-N4)-methyltransferase